MPFSVYEATIPPIIHGLNVVDDYLSHAQAFAEDRGWPDEQILGSRLASDMLTLGEQIAVLCNKVDAHVSKLLRRDVPVPVQVELSRTALRLRLAATRRFLEGLEEEDLKGAENHTFELSPPIVRGWFGGSEYIFLLVTRGHRSRHPAPPGSAGGKTRLPWATFAGERWRLFVIDLIFL